MTMTDETTRIVALIAGFNQYAMLLAIFLESERKMGKIREIKGLAWDKIEEINQTLDNQVVMKYYGKIMEEDGVTFEEAVQLCQTEPKYSMGLKMASPAVVMMLQTKKGRKTFESWLTPEELAVWNSPECPKNFRQMIKKEKKKQGARF